MVRDRTSDQIRQLVFTSIHGSRFALGGEAKEGVYTDLIWNAAATISCIDIVRPDHFSFISARTNKDIEKQRENLEKGRETQAAGGWKGLEKGRETQEAGGWKGLERSREIQAAGGWKNLEKGRETLAAGGWKSLERGRATLAARGYKHLADNNEVKREQTAAIRLAKLHALLRSFDVRYLLRHEASYYKDHANLKIVYEYFAGLRRWPAAWETFNQQMRRAYGMKIRAAHGLFTTLRDALDDSQMSNLILYINVNDQSRILRYALFYDKNECPFGLHWEGDDGPNTSNNSDPNIAIALFYISNTKTAEDKASFAQVIRDVCTYSSVPRLHKANSL